MLVEMIFYLKDDVFYKILNFNNIYMHSYKYIFHTVVSFVILSSLFCLSSYVYVNLLNNKT